MNSNLKITDTNKNDLFCNIYLKVSQKIMKFSGSDLKKKKNYEFVIISLMNFL